MSLNAGASGSGERLPTTVSRATVELIVSHGKVAPLSALLKVR